MGSTMREKRAKIAIGIGVVAVALLWSLFAWLRTNAPDDPLPQILEAAREGDLRLNPGIIQEGPEPSITPGTRVGPIVSTPEVGSVRPSGQGGPGQRPIDLAALDVCERAAWTAYPAQSQWGSRSKVMEGCRNYLREER